MSRRLAALAILASTLAAPAPAVSQTAPLAPAAGAASAASAAPAAEEERLLDASIPAERSPQPRPAEWPAAPRVRLTRRGPAAAGCRAYLLREWLRVRCPGEAFALSLLGGDLDGVAFWIDRATREGEVLVPLRRGGKHVVQFWKAGKDASGGFVPEPLVVLQQYWIDGAPAPLVTLF